ncbi:DNA-binding response regulator [Clostridium aestuarii]|uniref:DNA-binding response regulator n=1 Tax=Clostridium aestuarii TaxID=338193 RepID=A0ABT4D636_9CLOT|nr:DNA-binding response regulator [Clostridium aestuarii]
MYAKQLNTDDYIKDIVRNLNTKYVEITADNCAVGQAVSYLKTLHSSDDGYITIAVKRENVWHQYHYKEDEIEKNIGKLLSIEDINLYVSPNSFYKPFRRIENVRKLNSLYIDLDYYNLEVYKDLTKDQIIWQLEQDYLGHKVPEASFIVITGRGIAIYWLIEPVPYKALPLWNAVQKYFLKQLKEIGADSKSIDAARVMRLSGSTNQKNGHAVKFLICGQDRYNLREIQKEYLPTLTPYVKNPVFKRRGRQAKVVKLFTVYKLHYARLMDIVKLQELRNGYCRNENGELIKTGQREFMCFLYRYWECCFTNDLNKAVKDTLDFNKGFISPLSENEVISQTRAAENAYKEWRLNDFNITKKKDGSDEIEIDEELKKKANKVRKNRKGYALLGYNYTNETLIKQLCITEDEMKELKTIISKKEVKIRTNMRTNEYNKAKFKNQRRDEKGFTKREQSKLENMKVIRGLKGKGLTQREIAKEVGVSTRTVKVYYKEFNKQIM